MREEWKTVRLGDVLSVKHGFAFPGGEFSDDPTLPTLLTPGNFAVGGGFKYAKTKTFAGVIPEDYVLKSGDLVVTMTDLSKDGDTLGSLALVPDAGVFLHNQRIGLIDILDFSRVDRKFLNYALRSADYHAYIVGTASGSTVRHTSPTRICDYSAEFPPVEDQCAIAEVLGALDDKIAANEKLTEVAEKYLALQFEGLGMDSGSGEQQARRLDEYFDLNPTYRVSDPEPVYLDMQKLPTSGMIISDWGRREAKGGVRFMNGDTLMARITPCLENRKTGYVDFLADGEVAIGSTEYIALRSKPGVPQELSYFLSVSPRFRAFAIKHMVGTSGRQRLSANDLGDYELRMVDQVKLDEWGALAGPLVARLGSARDESRTLATIRDALLPQLMSGNLRVRDAEKQVEAVL